MQKNITNRGTYDLSVYNIHFSLEGKEKAVKNCYSYRRTDATSFTVGYECCISDLCIIINSEMGKVYGYSNSYVFPHFWTYILR